MNHTLITVGIIVAVLAVGGIVGYTMANNDPTDDSDGMTTSEMNENLQKYADGLNAKGGFVRSDGVNLQVAKGTVTVENGMLYFTERDHPTWVYYVPYTGIGYVFINP